MRNDIDADADRQRVAAAVELRGFQQDAGELGAVGQHVVRPFQLEAAACPAPCRHRRRCRSCRAARPRRAHRTAPARRRSRASRQASARRGRRAAASRQDCHPASPRRGRAGRARSPGASRRSRAFRDRRAARSSSASCIGRADRVVRFEPVAVEDGGRRQLKCHLEERLGGGFGHLADRPADQAHRTARRRRRRRAPARSSPDIGWKAADRLVEPHDLDDAQIVVGAHHRGQHADHRQRIELGIDRREEHVPLRPEAGERRNAGQREHQDGQDRRHHRVGRRQAGEVADLLDIGVVAPHRQDEGEGAERHHHVDQHVDGDAAHAGLAVGGEADQREAHMADRGIGHQPLDVRLADRGEGAEHHRGDRDEDDDLLPVERDRLEGADGDAHEQRHRRHLRRGGEEGRHRRRRAFVDVGRPHVERHGRDLEGEAGQHEDQAEDQAELALAAAARAAISWKPVLPV